MWLHDIYVKSGNKEMKITKIGFLALVFIHFKRNIGNMITSGDEMNGAVIDGYLFITITS